MSFCPFNSEDLAAAKGVFAEALFRENKKSPFGADPFKVALSIWPEETGELPKALWVAHSARWHEDAEVIEMLSDLEEETQAAIEEGTANNQTLWFMLFDLYRLTDGREAFEQRGVAFAGGGGFLCRQRH